MNRANETPSTARLSIASAGFKGSLPLSNLLISADEGSCEERVLRARTIEKGVTSLINHLFDCYIENTLQHEMRADSGRALVDMQKILKLINS